MQRQPRARVDARGARPWRLHEGREAPVGEDEAAHAVQQYFLPHTIDKLWTRKSPLEKANERIAKLEAFVEELLLDEMIDAAITADRMASRRA